MVGVAEKTASLELIAAPAIEKRIFVVRGRQVMLDEDLADLYGVETKRLVEQVKRNIERFPADFMFQLDETEMAALRSQIATSKSGRGGRRYAPYVFTEQGVAMLSSVLNSPRAIRVNIEIMRAFVRLRQMLASNVNLERRLGELEKKYDGQFKLVFEAIRRLMNPPENEQTEERREIGYHTLHESDQLVSMPRKLRRVRY